MLHLEQMNSREIRAELKKIFKKYHLFKKQIAFTHYTKITSTLKLDLVPKSGDYITYEDQEVNEGDTEIESFVKLIHNAINELETPLYRTLIIEQYINKKDTREVYMDLHISESGYHRLKGKAERELFLTIYMWKMM